MSIGSQQEIGAARRVSQKQLQICSKEDSTEESAHTAAHNRGATYISATHERTGEEEKKKGSPCKKQAAGDDEMNGMNAKPSQTIG